jgi:hypothetical protein
MSTPLRSVEHEVVTPAVSTPAMRGAGQEEEEELDEETPVRISAKMAKSALKSKLKEGGRGGGGEGGAHGGVGHQTMIPCSLKTLLCTTIQFPPSLLLLRAMEHEIKEEKESI